MKFFSSNIKINKVESWKETVFISQMDRIKSISSWTIPVTINEAKKEEIDEKFFKDNEVRS